MQTNIKGISRIDSKHTHGWFVRIYRDAKAKGKFFSDGVHGGREKALDVARQYRDTQERENPPDPFQGRVRQNPPKNNKSGVVGVHETYATWRNGRKVPYFAVTWCPYPNVPKHKPFYHHHYDSREAALEAAIEFRKAREAEILRAVQPEWQWSGNGRKRKGQPAKRRVTKSPSTRKSV